MPLAAWPLIAGYNDSEKHIKRIALLAKDTRVQKISFLPYHEGGKTKSNQLGKSYLMPEAKAPGEKHIRSLQRIAEKEGFTATIEN